MNIQEFQNAFKTHLQTVVTSLWFMIMVFGPTLGIILSIYLISYTRFCWITVLYISWIYLFDRRTPEQGGRRIKWLKSLSFWKYFNEYFPLRLDRTKRTNLDPSKNYLLCYFPCVTVPLAAFSAFAAPCTFNDIFPYHKSHMVTSFRYYWIPFFREIVMALGGCAPTARSIDYILQNPKEGSVCVLTVGDEMLVTEEGKYKVELNERKGFIYRALKNGTALVPVFSFGESDIFSQTNKSLMGNKFEKAASILPFSSSLIYYSIGLILRRRSVTTIIGEPIEVDRIDEPTTEDVNKLHNIFKQRLIKLFEEEKHQYLKNAASKTLEIL